MWWKLGWGHLKDLETQAKFGVSYLKYWADEQAGKLFCLVEAHSRVYAVETMQMAMEAASAGE